MWLMLQKLGIFFEKKLIKKLNRGEYEKSKFFSKEGSSSFSRDFFTWFFYGVR
jgi:hypothetical protein